MKFKMFYIGLFNYLSAIVLINKIDTVKINVEGTVSLGKDVMNSLSQFLGKSYNINARRAMMPIIDEDPITEMVRTAVLCRNLAFCLQSRKFIEEYITVLTTSLQTVLSELLKENFKPIMFEKQLKHYLKIVRNILERANSKVTEEKEVYYWINTVKTICARFQEMASIFVIEELGVDQSEVNKIKQDLNQKLVIATVLVETKYQTKLCVEYNVCIKSYEVTEALNILLDKLKSTSEDKVRLFIRYFYEALFDTTFYTHVSEKTAHELQVILNDMTYSDEVPTKEVLLTVQKIVEARLEAIETNEDEILSYDTLLVHTILSDMDHIYSAHKADPFNDFFEHFYDWLVDDVRIDKEVRKVMNNIGGEINTASDDMLIKLTREVKVFLEMSVDTEK